MIDPKDIDYVGLAAYEEQEQRAKFDYQSEEVKKAQLDMLNWFMKLCGSGMTTGMIRLIAHNKHVEISGKGEKA